ncbi:MAG: PH domain-containing protein [Thermoanaerobaculia bacterium]|nr:PH domain-containing protein [Thermoanaerobaculia bacterium]
MSAPETEVRRFPCTAGGGIAAGQRRLRWLLLGPAALMVVTAGASFVNGGAAVGGLCLLIALVAFVAWRMSGELTPQWVGLTPNEVVVRTRTRQPTLPRNGATARRLTESERDHLERLATTAGVVAPAGGFDSHLLGEVQLFASDLANAVLVASDEERWVVTPDDPEGFLAAMTDPPGPRG